MTKILNLLLQMGTVGKAIIDYYPGVKVPNVVEGTAAARAGLRSNDVVLQVSEEWCYRSVSNGVTGQ